MSLTDHNRLKVRRIVQKESNPNSISQSHRVVTNERTSKLFHGVVYTERSYRTGNAIDIMLMTTHNTNYKNGLLATTRAGPEQVFATATLQSAYTKHHNIK